MEAMSIRDAQKKDISAMAENLYETESFPKEIWGGENREETIKNIKKLIETKNSRYSLEFIKAVEYKSKLAGLIIIIPCNKIRYLNFKTDIKTLKVNKGFLNKFKFLISLVKFWLVSECEDGDLYIANLVTFKEFRGIGVAKFLLKYAENLALTNNFKRCSLIAKDRFVSKFYEKLNYITLQDYEIFGHEIIKMAKNI